jgi:nucleoside-diphosphate-sugar epimerase
LIADFFASFQTLSKHRIVSKKLRGLIIGCGYLGRRVAGLWNDRGIEVHALTRSDEKASSLIAEGFHPIIGDWYRAETIPPLENFDRVLIAVSHAPVPSIPSEDTHARGLNCLIDKLTTDPQSIAYLSTTGVYAPCNDGRWIDESSPVEPMRPGSIAALAAERWLSSHLANTRKIILRAAGIYGPERVPNLESLRKGLPIQVDPSSWLNLIHVDDLAEICYLAFENPNVSGVFNVADGNSVLRRDYYDFICRTIGSPVPSFEIREVGSGESNRRRGEGSKRISNQRLVESLDFRLRYPDFRAGLSPLLQRTALR